MLGFITGIGLGMMQALMLGLSVIATNYSASCEVMVCEFLLIGYVLVQSCIHVRICVCMSEHMYVLKKFFSVCNRQICIPCAI